MREHRESEAGLEYKPPTITDYGDLTKLTEATGHVVHTDVPLGSPPPVPGNPASAFS